MNDDMVCDMEFKEVDGKKFATITVPIDRAAGPLAAALGLTTKDVIAMSGEKVPYRTVYGLAGPDVFEQGRMMIAPPVEYQIWPRPIPVTERLPEFGASVLWFHKDDATWYSGTMRDDEGDGWWVEMDCDQCIDANVELSHWLPLPPPPPDMDEANYNNELLSRGNRMKHTPSPKEA